MRRLLCAAAIVCGIASAAVLAHHPFAAEFDWKKPTTVKGTVAKFDWKNPHSILYVKGTDDAGAEAEWAIELGAPAELTKAGWTRTGLRTGDKVTVDGWLAKDGSKRVSAKSVTSSNGREMFAAGAMFDTGTPREGPGNNRETVPTTGKTPTPAR